MSAFVVIHDKVGLLLSEQTATGALRSRFVAWEAVAFVAILEHIRAFSVDAQLSISVSATSSEPGTGEGREEKVAQGEERLFVCFEGLLPPLSILKEAYAQFPDALKTASG